MKGTPQTRLHASPTDSPAVPTAPPSNRMHPATHTSPSTLAEEVRISARMMSLKGTAALSEGETMRRIDLQETGRLVACRRDGRKSRRTARSGTALSGTAHSLANKSPLLPGWEAQPARSASVRLRRDRLPSKVGRTAILRQSIRVPRLQDCTRAGRVSKGGRKEGGRSKTARCWKEKREGRFEGESKAGRLIGRLERGRCRCRDGRGCAGSRRTRGQ